MSVGRTPRRLWVKPGDPGLVRQSPRLQASQLLLQNNRPPESHRVTVSLFNKTPEKKKTVGGEPVLTDNDRPGQDDVVVDQGRFRTLLPVPDCSAFSTLLVFSAFFVLALLLSAGSPHQIGDSMEGARMVLHAIPDLVFSFRSSSPSVFGRPDDDDVLKLIREDLETMAKKYKAEAEASEAKIMARLDLKRQETLASLSEASKVEAQSSVMERAALGALREEMLQLKEHLLEQQGKKGLESGPAPHGSVKIEERLEEVWGRLGSMQEDLDNCRKATRNLEEIRDKAVASEVGASKELAEKLQSRFVSKETMSERLAAVSAFIKEEMERVIEVRVRKALADRPAGSPNHSDSHISSRRPDSIDDVQVGRIVREALVTYDADKTGRFDFALESAGGSIVSTRCTRTYESSLAVYSVFNVPVWWETNGPRTILQPDSTPGRCWAFRGARGSVVIRLSSPVRISAVTLEHIPASLSPSGDIASAPKEFTVLGLGSLDDPSPVNLGNFTYQVAAALGQDEGAPPPPVQTFRTVSNTEHEKTSSTPGGGGSEAAVFQLVELQVLSNHGNDNYTCIYRFRVHGQLAEETLRT